MPDPDYLGRLDPILPLVRERADATNEARTPDPAVFRALARAGCLRMVAPARYGGNEAAPEEFLSLIEAIAVVDGSTAWTAMTLNEEMGIASAYLDPGSMTSLLAEEPDVIIAGSGLPVGRARAVDGGWRVTGRWRFVSGSPVADRLILASAVEGNDSGSGEGEVEGGGARRPRPVCFTLVRASDTAIEDTWHVAGLRGTGSNDVVLDDVFVPERWAGVAAPFQLPLPDTPFYCLPNGLRFPFPKVGVACGIARAALDAFDELARTKKPYGAAKLLAERPDAQAAMAQASALVGSGRTWVSGQVAELWATASSGRPIEPDLHARVRLACSYAVDSAIRAVEILATAAGTTAGQLEGPWPRLLSDARAVGQHFMVGPQQMQTAGRVLLGLDPADPGF
jgi:alkylation response protein AidB-like acyl-CoA dehydrogenase